MSLDSQLQFMHDEAIEAGDNPVRIPGKNAFKVCVSDQSKTKTTDIIFFRNGIALQAEAPWFPFDKDISETMRNCIVKYYASRHFSDKHKHGVVNYGYDEKNDQIGMVINSIVSNDPEDGVDFYTIVRETIICKCEEFIEQLVEIKLKCAVQDSE